ncbi:MAG: sporulation protein YabP [Bacillota bacterium]
MQEKKNNKHDLSMIDCKRLKMTGILEVINFNDDKVIIKSSQGIINILGKELNMQKLNLEDSEIKITGKINTISYKNNKTKKSFWKKIFNKK